jgi:hypothetical protein
MRRGVRWLSDLWGVPEHRISTAWEYTRALAAALMLLIYALLMVVCFIAAHEAMNIGM